MDSCRNWPHCSTWAGTEAIYATSISISSSSLWRQAALNWFSHTTKKKAGTDLLFLFKCIHGLVDFDHHQLGLELLSNATRSHGLNFIVQGAFSNRVDKAYDYRIAREWNSLPNFIKAVPSLCTFKAEL